ncbi:hypothetical protein FBU31_004728 [Coemansia sp. 'formosensis']|nr:hypothetical protein FBU31_004728 [Coemansia sp. 'formosensis']
MPHSASVATPGLPPHDLLDAATLRSPPDMHRPPRYQEPDDSGLANATAFAASGVSVSNMSLQQSYMQQQHGYYQQQHHHHQQQPIATMYSPGMGDMEPTSGSPYYSSPMYTNATPTNTIYPPSRGMSQPVIAQQLSAYPYGLSVKPHQTQQQQLGYTAPLMRTYSGYPPISAYSPQQQQHAGIAMPMSGDSMSSQATVMYQVGQPYQPGQVLGRTLDSYRTRVSVPPTGSLSGTPASSQYMLYRMPEEDGQSNDSGVAQQTPQSSAPQGPLHTIAEDEDDRYQNEEDDEQDLENDQAQDSDAGAALDDQGDPPSAPFDTEASTDAHADITDDGDASRRQSESPRDLPGLRVEIPLKNQQSRPRADAAPATLSGQRRSAASASRLTPASTPESSGASRAGHSANDAKQSAQQQRGRRFPLAVNTAARAAAGTSSNEPGPQTAMLIEYVQSLPSPSTFQPIVYQQNENYSPMEFGTTPIVGHQQTSAFQWPLPPPGSSVASAASRAPHQPSPLKRNVAKDPNVPAAVDPSPDAMVSHKSPKKRSRNQL